MKALIQLSKYIGALAAMVLCLGILTRSDLQLIEGQEASIISSMLPKSGLAEASMKAPAGNETPLSYSHPERPTHRVELPTATTRHETRASAIPVADRASRPKANIDLEEWINLNVAQTFLEAEKETMSPGVILATGIYFLEEGQGDMSMNAADVATYLAEVRHNAGSEAKGYMKYIANSDSWFTGLKKAGFDGERIAKLFNRYHLKRYDKEMYARFVSQKAEAQDYDRPTTTLSNEVEERNQSLAQAYNDYADRPEVRKKLGLPSIRKPRAMEREELSAGRKEAEAFTSGESRTYDEPRIFWAVLREMIALENDYDSWEAYHADHPQAADRAFRNRSNIMALGGVMKVTRGGGA